jgi:glycosyltransferase involved in cell wall biosynthesis
MTRRSSPHLSVVVVTYEWPAALDAVLWALSEQSDSSFDVVVSDDGSGPDTAAAAERWQKSFGSRLTYVRQDDKGYRLARARNLGALEAQGDYFVFMDGDTVPRRQFVRAMRRSAVPGWFVCSKRLLLSRGLTARVLAESLPIHRWSGARWALTARGQAQPLTALTPRDRRRPGRSRLPDFVPHADGYGFLLGVDRGDFVGVNGYDARYRSWGEEDVDLAVRLRRLGLRCGWPGPQGTLVHLWHETRKGDRPNVRLLEEAKRSDGVEAVEGLRELGRALS